MKRRLFFFVPVLLLTASISTGCWDRKEIVDIAIVMLTALDEGQKPGTFRAHILVANPIQIGGPGQSSSGSSQKEPIAHIVTEGRNIDEIRFKAERSLPRDMETSHRRVFIIGESLARRGIKEILDQISRNPMNRINTLLAVAEGMEAAKLVNRQVTLETFAMEQFRELAERKAHVPSSLKDYFIASTSPGQQPIAVSYNEIGNKVGVTGIAIFRDNKLKGFVKGMEAVALTALLGGKVSDSITIPAPNKEGGLSLHLEHIKVRSKVAFSKGEPIISFDVKASGLIMDNRAQLDLSDPSMIQKLDKVFAKEIEDTYRSLFERLQKDLRADSAGLGAMIYRKNPKYWKRIEKDWMELYPEQTINWKVSAQITGVGSFGAPIFIREDKVKK
ncbi:Ger(x)C family spore germination protein [Paenibacillus wynnii]|uniref:Ger(x)C family spore germination protein n=1 Tax=Paenibacillus wynnii TaxID=268407 RepID=UPI0027939859|nr:Ger(x)C family spore germination protein [Paenibacillus wynnii]MDQ0196589.1 Ger(x)C family germination protein [Paenibacillus wynnii]